MNNKKKLITYGAVSLFGILLAIIFIVTSGMESNTTESHSLSQKKWPDNELTEDYPEFTGDIYSVFESEKSTAVFIENAEQSAVDAYVAKLSSSGLVFSSDGFPKTTKADNLFITFAYDVNTKKLSITFILQEESSDNNK